jgi:putative proteasome-type protease
MQRRDAPFLAQSSIEANANMLVGGQIAQEPPRLFHVYAQGNFIEATDDTPYFQIGEHKYGKPILDRLAQPTMRLGEAAKLILLSFDSTMKSNISVVAHHSLVSRDSLRVACNTASARATLLHHAALALGRGAAPRLPSCPIRTGWSNRHPR